MRRAITLTQAIAVIVLISFLLIVTLKQASITAKHTGDSYAYQRAELFSNSAVEMAILAIHSRDRNANGCLDNITVSDEYFDANVTIKRYYLHSDEPNKCSNDKEIETRESNGMVWMKVKVTPKKEGKFKNNSDRNITLIRTTLQKL